MNDIFLTLGIEAWKPTLSALLLPPVPFLVLVLAGARLMFRRRLLAWFLVLLGVLGIWFSSTTAVSQGLNLWLLKPQLPLREEQIAELRRAPRTAIVVLGGGRRLLAPEYGVSSLHERGIERLRYGMWLSRETGLPLAFSGGIGHNAQPGPSEAEIAARIAEREFGRPLKWTETESRDTRENALRSVALLEPQGIEQIVLVTHGYHMPRALRNFQRAAEGRKITMVAAPMGMSPTGRLRASDWLPTAAGFADTRLVLHEWIGRLMGA
ncbi:MAG: YdcF family protein [Rubrivivax sp.]|nr:YdcF family protein [Rubrivivax sp.]